MKKLLEIKKFSISIGRKKICKDLDLCINPGEIWGILGPNGSGKTTFLHSITGLRPSSEGSILFEGKLLSQWNKKNLARKLGILLQDTQFIFPQTVFEYCLAGRYPHLSYFARETSSDHDIVFQALTSLELDHLRDQSVFTLSGGERRRLAIASLLAQSPNIYLLDEPMNHLDIRYQMIVMNHFLQLAQNGATIFMSLHDINLAQRYCNKILLLFENGEILFDETKKILNPENLTKLYKHSLHQTVDNVWLPGYQSIT